MYEVPEICFARQGQVLGLRASFPPIHLCTFTYVRHLRKSLDIKEALAYLGRFFHLFDFNPLFGFECCTV